MTRPQSTFPVPVSALADIEQFLPVHQIGGPTTFPATAYQILQSAGQSWDNNNMTLLIRTTSLTGFYELVTRLNGNPDTLLRRFHIDPAKVIKLEGVLPYSTKINLIEEAARQLDCADFGLRLAQEQDLMVMGPIAAVALNAPTVGEAMENIASYVHYHSPGIRLVLDRDSHPDEVYLKLELNGELPYQQQSLEHALGQAHNSLKMLYGRDFRPLAVLMRPAASPGHERYQQYFQAPVFFARECDALVLNRAHLDRAIDQNNPALHELLGEYINDALLDEPLDLPHQVKQLIHRLLPTQRCNLQTVSQQLGLHKRTLQRRLAEQDIIFEELVDGIRRERADNYLSLPEMPMTQIAGLLGYREQSSFNRACRRWYGITPLKRRRELQQSALLEEAQAVETIF